MKSIKSATDLVTEREATIRGFEWQAKEKHKRAEAFVENAQYFATNAAKLQSITDVKKDSKLVDFCIASSMLSRKSLSHLTTETRDKILSDLIDFKSLNDPKYVADLQGRYYLTSGDSLGGTMRNVVGQAAQERLTNSIYSALENNILKPRKIWNKGRTKVVGISWTNRLILFDKKPKFINKSIDFIVLKGNSAKSGHLEAPDDYVACGELKGGIDPAGADEHWKTAKSALDRIREAFNQRKAKPPKLMFIGSAIEAAMAAEIFGLIASGWLAGAANATRDEQFKEIVEMIIA